MPLKALYIPNAVALNFSSTKPTKAVLAPKTEVKKIGINGKIMSEDRSFKKLTAPMEITFLESPKNLVGFLTSF